MLVNNTMVFIVPPGELGKAIGRGGANIKRIQNRLNRKIKIVEFSPEISRFLENIVFPLKISSVTVQEGIATMIPIDYNTRGLLIGRNASELRFYEAIVQRFFDIKKLRVTDGSQT